MSEIESPIQHIKPPELAIELAKGEMKEKEKNAFEASLLKRIIEQYLIIYKKSSEKWSEAVESGTQFGRDFAAFIKSQEANGGIPSFDKVKNITNISDRLKVVFEYNSDGSVKSFSCDLLYPKSTSPMTEDEYIEQVADIGDYSIKFGAGGLPARDQQHIKETDLSAIPQREKIYYLDNINFSKIWDEEELENPKGARYFLEEIILKEESDLQIALRNLSEELQQVEEGIKEKREKGGAVGGLRTRYENLQRMIKLYSGHLDGLIQYRRKYLPGG